MKSAPFVFLAAFVLAGCEASTLEEAQAQCAKKGGLLVVIYSQPITAAGLGPETASPGDCLSPSQFDPPPPKTAPSH